MQRNQVHKRWAFLTAGLGLLAALVLALQPGALAQDGEADAGDEATMVIGTYQPSEAFGSYPGRQDFMQTVQDLRRQAQAAQQAGQPDKLMDLQEQMQQAQQQVVSRFEADLEKVMPKVADEAGVDAVAVQVVHAGEGIETRDVTNTLVKHLGEIAPATQPATTQPAE